MMSYTKREQNHEQMVNICPVCGGKNNQVFLQIDDIPVHCCLLVSDKEEAVHTRKGNIHLSYCYECGHIFNKAFDPAKMAYSEHYENALYFSPAFQKYAKYLATYLAQQYQLSEKDIIEIGCGQGYFLSQLCRIGNNRGLGFDPGYRLHNQDLEHPENVKFVQGYFSRQTSGYKADMIVCRQVLEHVYDMSDFLDVIKETVGYNNPAVFFEVPNAEFMLKEFSIWDVIYEHYSYFSKRSLTTLFQNHGFEVKDVYELFDDQYLGIEAQLTETGEHLNESMINEDLSGYAHKFERLLNNKIDHWTKQIREWTRNGRKFILWGAGAKGITFLNFLNINNQMEYVIDMNPRKHGKFVNGAGQKIMPPDFLRNYRPDIILIMNSVYEEEIRQQVRSMGVNAEVVSV